MVETGLRSRGEPLWTPHIGSDIQALVSTGGNVGFSLKNEWWATQDSNL